MTPELKRISLSVAALLVASNGFANAVTNPAAVKSEDQYRLSEQERSALLEMLQAPATVEANREAELAVKREPAVLPPVSFEVSTADVSLLEDEVPLTDVTDVQLED